MLGVLTTSGEAIATACQRATDLEKGQPCPACRRPWLSLMGATDACPAFWSRHRGHHLL